MLFLPDFNPNGVIPQSGIDKTNTFSLFLAKLIAFINKKENSFSKSVIVER